MAAPHPHLALFPHGLSAGAKLFICLLVSIMLIIADARFHALTWLRSGMSTELYVVENTVAIPWRTWQKMDAFFVKQQELLAQNKQLQQQSVVWQLNQQQNVALQQENHQLRALLGLRQHTLLHTLTADIIGIPRDPFQRKVRVDAGSQHGVQVGVAVIDAQGLLGQITQVYPLTSDVTLLTDKDQSIPIQIQRTGEHAILFGTGSDHRMELRYLDHSTDIRRGDILITSGLDGLYPPGINVAIVSRLGTTANQAFDRIDCQPLAGVERDQHVLILSIPHLEPRSGD